MPDAPAAAPPPAAEAPAKKPKEYTLKFEPIGDFNLETLFVRGFLAAKIWLTDTIAVELKSLTGEEVDEVNNSVFKLTEKMTQYQYNTEVTYRNLAHSVMKLGSEAVTGTFEEKVAKTKKRAGSVIGRMQLAYLELNDRIDDLYVPQEGKEQESLGKKS